MKTLKSLIAIFSLVILFLGTSTLLDTKDAGACPIYESCADPDLYQDLCFPNTCRVSATKWWNKHCGHLDLPC